MNTNIHHHSLFAIVSAVLFLSRHERVFHRSPSVDLRDFNTSCGFEICSSVAGGLVRELKVADSRGSRQSEHTVISATVSDHDDKKSSPEPELKLTPAC